MAHDLIVGSFDTEEAILKAARAAHKAGLPVHDAFTPFPVHGMDEALGLPKSGLPTVCFRFGLAGALATLGFQYWVSLFDWPMNIGGKSYNASPALIPVAFELTVLFAGLGTVFWFLRSRRLSPFKRPSPASHAMFDDRFVLALRCGHDGEGADALRRFLAEQGAQDVREAGMGR